MDLKYIKVDKYNKAAVNGVYEILKLSGEYMLKHHDLNHWYPAYGKDKIELDIINKDVFLVSTVNSDKNINTFQLDFSSNYYVELNKFATHPLYQGRGVGSQVFNYIEIYCVKKGFSKIRLDVYEKSKESIMFYKRRGFSLVGEKKTRRFTVLTLEKKLID